MDRYRRFAKHPGSTRLFLPLVGAILLLLFSAVAAPARTDVPTGFVPGWFSRDSVDTYSVAWGDVDGDGDLDLAAGNEAASNKLYRNDGGKLNPVAAWSAAVTETTHSVAWGDMNGDGLLDLAVGNSGEPNKVYLNLGGTLEITPSWEADVAETSTSVAWGDVDGDGFLDLAVGNDGEPNKVYLNLGGTLEITPSWEADVPETSTSVAWGDVDGDGFLDLAVGNDGEPNKVYLNVDGALETTPSWEAAITGTTYSVAWGDVDGDGDLDLAVGNYGGQDQLYRNDDWMLTSDPVWTADETDNTTSVAWGDIDGDGDLDLVVGNQDQPKRVYLNDNGILRTAGMVIWNDTDDSYSVALGDMEGDGDLDIAAGNAVLEPNKVYLNQRGTIEAAPAWSSSEEENTTSVAWGDVNGDGLLDLAVGSDVAGEPVRVYLNQDGMLEEASSWSAADSNLAYGVAWGDMNGDGLLDLAVGNYGTDGGPGQANRVYLNVDGTLSPNAAWSSLEDDHTTSVAWGDVDGDGDLDLAVGNYGDGEPVRIYLNQDGMLESTASWSADQVDWAYSVAWGDMDGDGDLDLAVGGYKTQNQVYLNDKGTLQQTPIWTSEEADWTASVAWGDVNGDGLLDLAAGDEGQQNKVYMNMGGMLESAASWRSLDSDWTESVAWGDADGDGDLDLAAASIKGAPLRLYLNEGGRLQESAGWTSAGPQEAYSVAWGDVDGDGDLDLAVGEAHGPNRVYLNQRPAAPDHPGQAATVALALYSDPVQSFGGTVTALAPANFYAVPAIRDAGTIPITYTLFNPNGADAREVRGFYSPDGGGKWLPAVPALGAVTTTLYTATAGLPLAIPDEGTAVAALSIGDDHPIAELQVWLVISHTYDSDLEVYLESPQGTQVLLFSGVGADGRDFNHTWLDDQASISIEDGVAPFAGTYAPVGSLDSFYGESPAGSWTLIVVDAAAGDTGTLREWGLRVKTASGQAPALTAGWGDTYSSAELQGIPDPGAVTASVVITEDYEIADLDVWVAISHTYDGQLAAYLLSPAGTRVDLFANVGDDGENLERTWFSDQAGTAIVSGTAPFTGTYRPSGRLASLNEEWTAGTWQLVVSDDTAGEAGTLLGWGLRLKTTSPQHVYNWDVLASNFLGQSDNVVFRLEVWPSLDAADNGLPGPFQRPFVSAQTFPFRVRGNQVRVMLGGAPAAGAIVYRIPRLGTGGGAYANAMGEPFRTDAHGYLQGRGQLELGDRLVAMLPISATDSYTLCYTSATPTLSGLQAYTVTSLGVQTLTVFPANPLILFNLDISLEWDARYDAKYLSQLRFDLQRASEVLYDWTNGQAALGRVTIYHERAHWNDADVRIYATNRLRPSALQGGITTAVLTDTAVPTVTYAPGQVHMGAVWNRYGDPGGTIGEDWPRTLAHELGHWALFLDDNYMGLDAGGLLMPVRSCPSAMSDSYRKDYPYDEFHAAQGWLPECQDTLSNRSTGRADWSTIMAFYPQLSAYGTITNTGPDALPVGVTQVQEVQPITPSRSLADPTFYLTMQGRRVQPGNSARAFLFRGGWLTDLGRPTLDHVLARGASVGDRLCVYELAAGRLGCTTIAVNVEQLELITATNWQPDVTITPVTSRTIALTVTNIPNGLPILARLFPVDGPAGKSITLAATAGGYAGTFHTLEPVLAGYVQIWVDEAEPRREIVTDYTMGGNPGGIRGSMGGIRGSMAPAVSADGQVILFGKALKFEKGEFYVLQAATVLPEPLSWATVVGQAYRLKASPRAPDLVGTSISFSYIGSEVPAGEERWLRVYYWNGSTWRLLPTRLDSYQNSASAPTQGQGLYVLMSSIEVPLSSGWNLFSYPIPGSRPVVEALRSITTSFSLVYGYDTADPTDPWKVYGPGAPAWVNDLDDLQFGRGYWISATEAITLYLKGASEEGTTSGFPTPPATYYGPVQGSASFTPTLGMAVTAWVEGHLCGQGQTLEVGGQVVYVVSVAADDEVAGCGAPGKVVSFQVSLQTMSTTALWGNGRLWSLPLQPGTVEGPFRIYLPVIVRNSP